MGFFDDIQASMNRGMASAGRAVDTQKIKVQMSDAMKRRQALAAQLDELDRQAQQASKAATSFACPFCGAPVAEGDAFCMSCGHKLGAPSSVE